MSQPANHGLAHQLSRMPPELVHEIINDIPLVQILSLICELDVPHVEDCICSHFYLGKMFSPDFLAEVKSLFALLLRIRLHSKSALPRFDYGTTSARIKQGTWGQEPDPEEDAALIVATLKAAILKELDKYGPFLPVLEGYAPQSIPGKQFWATETSTDLQDIFEILDTAEERLNATKSSQLMRMANIVKIYPGMVRTRWDTSQDHHRNDQHLIDELLRLSDCMQKRQILTGRFVAKSIFSCRRPYLVPYDRLLRLFLKTIRKFSPFPEDDQDQTSKPSLFPREMKEVLSGLQEIYRREGPRYMEAGNSEHLPRILCKKPSAKVATSRFGALRPNFELEPRLKVPAGRIVDSIDTLMPAAEKELDWLEDFLSVCRHMSMMNEVWNRGQTVGEYWRKH